MPPKFEPCRCPTKGCRGTTILIGRYDYQCRGCGKKWRVQPQVNTNLSRVPKETIQRLKCSHCQLVCPTEELLKKHEYSHTGIPAQFNCLYPGCCYVFILEADLKKHQRQCKKKFPSTSLGIAQTASQNFGSLHVEGPKTLPQSLLDEQFRDDDSDEVFNGFDAAAAAPLPIVFNQHKVSSSHITQKRFCKRCKKKFASKQLFKVHQFFCTTSYIPKQKELLASIKFAATTRKHKLKIFTCEFCDEIFNTLINYQEHLETCSSQVLQYVPPLSQVPSPMVSKSPIPISSPDRMSLSPGPIASPGRASPVAQFLCQNCKRKNDSPNSGLCTTCRLLPLPPEDTPLSGLIINKGILDVANEEKLCLSCFAPSPYSAITCIYCLTSFAS